MIEIRRRFTGEVLLAVDADNLTGANLYRANLSGTKLTGASLRLADLTGARLSGADLTGANLSATTAEASLGVTHRASGLIPPARGGWTKGYSI